MIAIIDYNAGNLKSVEKALISLGEQCMITRGRQSDFTRSGSLWRCHGTAQKV